MYYYNNFLAFEIPGILIQVAVHNDGVYCNIFSLKLNTIFLDVYYIYIIT